MMKNNDVIIIIWFNIRNNLPGPNIVIDPKANLK